LKASLITLGVESKRRNLCVAGKIRPDAYDRRNDDISVGEVEKIGI